MSLKAERLELITRRNCPLCDLASAALAEVAATRGLGISAFDVDDDPQLLREFTERVPVVRYRGQVLAEGRTDASRLLAALAALDRTA
ncbi:MAG: glutaredoxin family protein [Candidatus Dormiibacterota bacterium]